MAQVSSDTRHTVAGGPRVGCVVARSPVTRWSEHGEQTLVHGTWYCYMVLATSTVSKLWYMVLVLVTGWSEHGEQPRGECSRCADYRENNGSAVINTSMRSSVTIRLLPF